MNTAKLLDVVKKNQDIKSDGQLARLLETSPQNVSYWRKGRSIPTGIMMLKIVKLSVLSIDDAIIFLTQKDQEQAASES